jgi:hypothetical protein
MVLKKDPIQSTLPVLGTQRRNCVTSRKQNPEPGFISKKKHGRNGFDHKAERG